MRCCHKCSAEWTGEKKPAFRALCPKCSADIHCCLNCRLYDPGAHNKCRSRTTEMVADREKANFCDEFDFADSAGQRQTGAPGSKPRWDSLWR